MRELKIVGLDVDGKHVICEGYHPDGDAAEKFKIRIDNRLRAAVRGDGAQVGQTHIDIEVTSMLRPKEIQARIRAGASVEQLAAAAGVDIERVERFAHPVLPVLETVTSSLLTRGLNPDSVMWDAWRNEDGRWTVQLAWKAGRSDNLAH